MTISEMHIAIDLLLQRMNSEIDAEILPQEKDFFINYITNLFIKSVLLNDENSINNYVSRNDIHKYYEALQSFINEYELNLINKGKYYSAKLPITDGYNNSIKSGKLINGVTYKIKTAGATDLSEFGYTGQSSTFVCNIKEVSDISQLSVGAYKIINTGTIVLDDNSIIYDNTNPGSVFYVTGNHISSSDSNTLVKPLESIPVWDGVTELEVVRDISYYAEVGLASYIANDNIINSNNIVVGNSYVVNVNGIDISSIYEYNITFANANMVFSTNSSTIAGLNDYDLFELDVVDNRLVFIKELNNYLNNSFGNIKTNPIYTYTNNEIRIYTNNKFKIYKAILNYIIMPRKVDSINNIDSNLPESLHEFIIELVVKHIAAIIGSPEYQLLRNEIIENNKIIKQ